MAGATILEIAVGECGSGDTQPGQAEMPENQQVIQADINCVTD